jgi:hypothetical protein
LSFGSGAEATAVTYLFWVITASGRRFDDKAAFDEVVEEIRLLLEVVQSDRAEQPAFRSWLLFCRNELRSITAANAETTGSETTKVNKNQIIHKVVVNLDEIEAKGEAE